MLSWFHDLFLGTGIAHSIFVLTLAIAAGVFLGNQLKFKGITLGVTWILFSEYPKFWWFGICAAGETAGQNHSRYHTGKETWTAEIPVFPGSYGAKARRPLAEKYGCE